MPSSTSSADLPPSLLAVLQSGVAEAVRPWQPEFVYLFGSVLTGTAGPGSDIDIAIRVTTADPVERRQELLAMRRSLVQRLGFANVVVADLHEAEPAFLMDVIQGLCLYARSPEDRLAFEHRAMQAAGLPAGASGDSWDLVTSRVRAGILAPPPPIPADRLERLIFTITEQTRNLIPVAALAVADFLDPAEPQRRFATAHLLRANLETVLSVARLLAVIQGWTRSAHPEELLGNLVRHGVISTELGEHLRLICLLRQPLTHPEDGIDFGLVHAVISENLDVFAGFLRQVVTFVERQGLLGP